MKRRSFIQGALLAIPLVTPAIANDSFKPMVTPFEEFRAEALSRLAVYELPSRGIFEGAKGIYHLQLCFLDGDLVHSTESYNHTYDDFFDEADDLEKLTEGFIASAYQHYKKENTDEA